MSKDISLLHIRMYDMEAKTVIHYSDIVSVIVACSINPVVVDHEGLIRLSNILTSVEERLSAAVTGCLHTISQLPQIHIPEHDSWIVTMWHFGHDSPNEYTGDEFEITWEDGQNALFRIYTKDLNGITKIRRERQEYPNKRFDEAIDENLHTVIKMRAHIIILNPI